MDQRYLCLAKEGNWLICFRKQELYIKNFKAMLSVVATDSSDGRAVDCRGVDIHRSLVRIRLGGLFFFFFLLLVLHNHRIA